MVVTGPTPAWPPHTEEISMLENRSMPPSTATPVIVYRDMAKAIDWLGETFGFREVWRVENHIALLASGEGFVFVREPVAGKEFGTLASGECRGSLMWRVDDVTLHHERVGRAGARILQALQDEVHGERQFTVEDLDGHHWTFSESIADVAPEEWGARIAG
jgi:uncharacterized glyoxalase superfamily protein PhnB